MVDLMQSLKMIKDDTTKGQVEIKKKIDGISLELAQIENELSELLKKYGLPINNEDLIEEEKL